MEKTIKYARFYCKHCGTIENIPDNLDGIKIKDLTKVYCPRCLAKNKNRKMIRIKDEN